MADRILQPQRAALDAWAAARLYKGTAAARTAWKAATG